MQLKAALRVLFGRGSPKAPERPQETPAELEALAVAINAQYSEIAQLRLEWAETLDKFTAWANRQAARDRMRLKKKFGEVEDSEKDTEYDLTPPRTAHPIGGTPMEGIPQEPVSNRHHKAELYARINRR